MNTIDSYRRIDLPAPPLHTTIEEGNLENAKVDICLLNGDKISGRLLKLDATNKILSINTKSDAEDFQLPFDKICCLLFLKKLAANTSKHPAEKYCKNAELPPPFQPYLVEAINGEIFEGKTRGSFIDMSGTHIFKSLNARSIQRLFFPIDSVKHQQIGNLIGAELLNMKGMEIKKEDIEQALTAQKVTREKSTVDYLVENEDISLEDAAKVLESHQGKFSEITNGDSSDVAGQVLVDENKITPEQLSGAELKKELNQNKKLGTYLKEMGALNDEDLNRVLAKKSGIPYIHLSDFKIEPEAIQLVSQEIASRYTLMPLRMLDGALIVAMKDPFQKEAIDSVQFMTNLHLDIVVASEKSIKDAIEKNYGKDNFEQDVLEAEDLQTNFAQESMPGRDQLVTETAGIGKPVVRLVSNFLIDAIHRQASDIHIRPLEKTVDLLFRIDGTLFKIRNFSKALLPPIISRIKILGKMDIAERRLPQDGQARITDQGNVVDLRISIIPTVTGESAVIRLLNTQTGIKSIAQLGFNPRDAEVFSRLLHKSNGMILVTGPTGSGKSTTLYAALQTVIERNLNIITVENPVEYHIDGIEQIQVNTVPGYTFARALRHILRHDPDVIMIGEIRDEETAKIAVESALTGHLVLSTLHTNDSAGAITRLLEMGVDPFLLNATILGIFAQRLAKKNCKNCLLEETVDPIIRKTLNIAETEVFYKGCGCEACHHTGYKGRIAVYELLQVTTQMHHLIQPSVATHVIHDQAIKDGMIPLTENALEQARKRLISLEEVYRVRLED
ncbi:MAG: Flp pilus assembly complex ATPase component TadA [Gammaproteobacteria bacterium]|nr:Flp pilus assembly complex ATPase component TadA [Gammaproteobacteria bacterium]